MKKYTLIIASIILSATLLTACSDSFIDVPSANENSDDYFNSEEDYELALIGAYDLLQASFWNVMIGEIASDNTLAGGDSENIDGPAIRAIDNMEHNDVNDNLRDIWNWMYAGLNRTNYILEFKDKTDFISKDNIIGQALFLRAYYTFELTKWFGRIPLLTEDGRIQNTRVQIGDEFTIKKTESIAATYELIEADLVEAIGYLNTIQDQEYKITKGAAQSLLGKVYLYHAKFDTSKFDAAATVFEDVIGAGNYTLVPNYADIFENSGENGNESIFEIQYTDLEGASFVCLQCSEGNVAVGFNGVRSYQNTDPLNTRILEFDPGYGYNTPTQEAVDAFEAGDTRKDATIFDPRTVAETTFDFSDGATGYYNKKYLPRTGDLGIGDNNLTNPNNYRAIRYADVLLMAAEAHNLKSTPDDVLAMNYLNKVRQRAFGDTAHNTNASGTTLTEAIWNERRVELIGEGHRFFDLVRTEKAAEAIQGFTSNKNEIFPIPFIEMQLAGAIERWGQNPGY